MATHYALSPKTRVLNLLRHAFRIPPLERALRAGTERAPQGPLRKLIPPDYLYPAGSMRSLERGGIRYLLDISHVVDHYLYFGIRDADYSRVEPEIRSAKVILDIGGNIGTTALYFASLSPQAAVHSFEPHPTNLARAHSNFALNSFKGITMHPCGLGASDDTFKLYEVEAHNPGMNRILQGEQNFPFVEINVRRLDDVMSELGSPPVDFVKIDVEGFEYSVLEGARRTLEASHPTLFVELDDGHLRGNGRSAAELIALLKSMGYTHILRASDGSAITAATNFERCHYDIIAKAAP